MLRFLEKEVFRKETLETKVKESMDEKRGKQKRRDRVSKAKTQSATKSKVSRIIYGVLFTSLVITIPSQLPKTGGDVLAQIKSKENTVRTMCVYMCIHALLYV